MEQDLLGLGENLGFYPEERENPGELWAEGWGLSQMFTGALCWLLRENCQDTGKGRAWLKRSRAPSGGHQEDRL